MSVSEIVYGIRLPRLVAQRKVDKSLLEEDIGETLENALILIEKRAQKCMNKLDAISVSPDAAATSQTHDVLMAELIVDPERVKQNNLLKGILILPHLVDREMTVLVFAKVFHGICWPSPRLTFSIARMKKRKKLLLPDISM